MSALEEVRARLTGAGGPFAIVEESVLGERMRVFEKRLRSLRQVLEGSAAQGEKEYIVHDERRFTYAQHLRAVASTAAALRERSGVGPGDRVAVLAANCAEWPIAFWATTSLGGITAALNSMWTADEIAHGIEDSAPKLLIADRKRIERMGRVPAGVHVVEIESEFEALTQYAPDAKLPDVPIAEDDRAVILYTSGTTGRPKGAVGTHRGIIGFVQSTSYKGLESLMVDVAEGKLPQSALAAPRAQGVMMLTSPMFHLSGLYATIVMQLLMGGKIVIRSGRFDPEEVLKLIARERVTAVSALGNMGPRIAKHPNLKQYDVSSVNNVGFGGAPVSPTVQELMREAFPSAKTSLGMGYGSSESVSTPVSIRGAEYERHPKAAGRLIVTHEVEIRDPHGKPLPEGAEGEIHVRSPYTMLEYWQNPEATAKSLLAGRWLATGDIGRFEDGLLYINSRARDMILRNAENVYPVEIEYRLEQHPDVREAAVYGIDHEEWGMAVKASVVPEPGRTLDAYGLARWCGEALAAYKVPTAWDLRAEPLPRNASGKVLKNVLQGRAENAFVEE